MPPSDDLAYVKLGKFVLRAAAGLIYQKRDRVGIRESYIRETHQCRIDREIDPGVETDIIATSNKIHQSHNFEPHTIQQHCAAESGLSGKKVLHHLSANHHYVARLLIV